MANEVIFAQIATHQLCPGLSALFDKLAGDSALGDAQLIGTAVHHAGILSGADVAHQDVGDSLR
jgi:hypothetical protein